MVPVKRAGVLALCLPLVLGGLGGCGKEEQQVQAPPPPPPPRQLGPLEDLGMDPRVQFPEAREPSTREIAEAIAEFASALVQGDDSTMSAMLDESGREVLSLLKSEDQWKDATSRIETVRVCTLTQSDDAFEVGLGVQDPDGAYLLAWKASRGSEGFTFAPMAVEYQRQESVAMLDNSSLAPPSLPEPIVTGTTTAPAADEEGSSSDR
jgi:hypothetical protein